MDKNSAQMDNSIRRLFDITPIPTAISLPTGKLEYTNAALRKLLGYSEAELMSDSVVITHPDDLALNKRIRAQLFENPTDSVQTHKRYIHKDGHSILAVLNMSAECDDEGNITRLVSQIIDLSGPRQSQAAELLLDQLVRKSHDAIYVVDMEFGQILNCNELGYQRLGYTKEELLRLTVPDINPLFNREVTWKDHVEKMKQAQNRFVEATHKRKDGVEIPIEANISMVEFNGENYFLAIVRDISERKAREQLVIEKQNLDPLTSLPNRRLLDVKLQEMICHCWNRSEKIAFMFLDIDNFKVINDTYGHVIGDEILVALAERLQDFTRQTDVVSRLGGDEFLVVLPGLNSREHVLSIANHLLQVSSHPIDVHNGDKVTPELSIGTTLCLSGHIDIQQAIHIADTAMYEAKKTQGSSSYFIDYKKKSLM
ncbi:MULTISPECIES: sensor domain-containing diguanylate cyclase [Vibrio]|uniref:sensor domain-containing diguanylate cyclase n=1 Tax=Vibrio TaxID=662 RepID=UPI001F183859|nr:MULTISPECIES: sensor domain-containing diguanylate cyclase [Vibrio]MCF4172653.1 diguanylate cyclase [Vibrio sp. McD22-P3]MCY9855533.1 diguanylate cyclase [Vibrio mediterranei]